MRKRLAILAALLSTSALVACSPQDRAEVRSDTSKAADSAGKAINKAADATGEAVSDASITAKVKSALLADEQVKGMRINVDTANQMVTLTGQAQSSAAKQRAEQLALQVDGVKSVQNNITVNESKAKG